MTTLGVVGGGTMGGGIVQVAAQQGMSVVLWDVRDDLLAASISRIRGFIQRGVERGRTSQVEADAIMDRITTTTDFAAFADVDGVIEAVLETLEAKTNVFRSLDLHCPPRAILATNTSSLSVTEIAAATTRPESVVGLHFFNPVPLMALVEVVRGSATSAATMDRATSLARELGKTPVRTEDTPGFIVNRVVRPFYNEALRILNDGVASFRDIDQAMKGAGFRMGPFELMDLIGNDVNLAVTSSIFEQFYGDPKYRPSFRQQRMVESGFLGRKTKQGWYDYSDGKAAEPDHAPDDSVLPIRSAAVIADSGFGVSLAEALAGAGARVASVNVGSATPEGTFDRLIPNDVDVIVEATTSSRPAQRALVEAVDRASNHAIPIAALALSTSATEIASWCRAPERVCGFGYLPPLAATSVVEVAPGLQTGAPARAAAVRLAATLGKRTVVLQNDACGLIAPRIVSLIVNEAAFALTEGVASADDIDAAVRLGANYPHGPLQWADVIGVDMVYTVIGSMFEEMGDDRYRPAPLLRRMAQAGWHGQQSQRGFFSG